MYKFIENAFRVNIGMVTIHKWNVIIAKLSNDDKIELWKDTFLKVKTKNNNNRNIKYCEYTEIITKHLCWYINMILSGIKW